MPTQKSTHDTTPEAESILIQLLRAKPPSERLADAVLASNRVAEQCKNAIRRMNPEISDDEVKLRFIALNYGSELADRVRDYLSANNED